MPLKNTTTPRPPTKKKVTFVHHQYNSPLDLYSPEEVAETLQRHTRLLSNGAVGIDFTALPPPNIKRSEVLKMLTEEQQEQQHRRPWQMHRQSESSSEMKRVAWPPANPAAAESAEVIGSVGEQTHSNRHDSNTNSFGGPKVAPPVPPKPGAREISKQLSESEIEYIMGSNGTPEPFASNELVGERTLIAKPTPPSGLILGRPLKKQTPISQEPQAVFDSQPVFKRAIPVRMLGDMVWPPKGASSTSSDNSRQQSPGPVRRQPKNYQQFFGQNQLPANFPTYRAPPGTQHFGLEEGENSTPM